MFRHSPNYDKIWKFTSTVYSVNERERARDNWALQCHGICSCFLQVRSLAEQNLFFELVSHFSSKAKFLFLLLTYTVGFYKRQTDNLVTRTGVQYCLELFLPMLRTQNMAPQYAAGKHKENLKLQKSMNISIHSKSQNFHMPNTCYYDNNNFTVHN